MGPTQALTFGSGGATKAALKRAGPPG